MPEIMQDVEVKVEFEVWCDTCGKGLCSRTRVNGDYVYIEACPACIENERADAEENVRAEMQERIDELTARINELTANFTPLQKAQLHYDMTE